VFDSTRLNCTARGVLWVSAKDLKLKNKTAEKVLIDVASLKEQVSCPGGDDWKFSLGSLVPDFYLQPMKGGQGQVWFASVAFLLLLAVLVLLFCSG
jgi:hypothetical protein